MKLRNFAIASAITAGSALTGLFAFGVLIGQTCVPGNAAYEAGTGICVAQNAATAKEKAIADKQAAEQKLKDEKARAEQVRRAEAYGDIYAQINIMHNGVVTGWTNDTAFLDKGQRGVLTFQKYGLSNGAAYQAQLTKFNARGSW